MGRALELITVQATTPSAGASMSAVAGNSLTIRDTDKPVWMVAVWQRRQVAGFTRWTSPLLHDAVVGMQLTGPIGVTVQVRAQLQRLHAQDTLIAFGSGSAVAGAIEQSSFLAYYEDLPGVSARLIDVTELNRRGEELYCWSNTLALGTGGGYSGAELINAEQDQLKANRDYAILGYNVRVAAHCVRWVGSDFGNLGVGGPAGSGSEGLLTSKWFESLSELTGLPLIPVFNSANKGLTFIDGATDDTGVDLNMTTVGVRLAPK